MTWLTALLEFGVDVAMSMRKQAALRMAKDAAMDRFPKSMTFKYMNARVLGNQVAYWVAHYRNGRGVGNTKAEAANMALKDFANG